MDRDIEIDGYRLIGYRLIGEVGAHLRGRLFYDPLPWMSANSIQV